ncbi:YbaB/EbfC family nucleoid-associated protein [Actinophytocola sediminis]
MTDPADRRAQLEARNAAMRENVAALMTDLQRRTADLADAQARANAVTGRATSADGLVRVEVNPAGVLTNIEFSQVAYERLAPERLARVILQTAQVAAREAREQVDEVLAPLRNDSADLSNLFEGAPSFTDLLRPPEVTAEDPDSRRDEDDDNDDTIYGRD